MVWHGMVWYGMACGLKNLLAVDADADADADVVGLGRQGAEGSRPYTPHHSPTGTEQLGP